MQDEESGEVETTRDTPGDTEISSMGSQTPAKETETDAGDTEEDTELSKDSDKEKSIELRLKSDTERPTSVVKFASHLEVADIPRRSATPLSSRMSFMEDGTVKHSRLSTATVGTENMVFGRDAVLEREKINNEARNTFAVMDQRYQDMVDDLIELDNAFELGLLDGNREEFEKRIQNVRIVKTPPKRPQELPRIELTVDGVIPGEDERDTDVVDGKIGDLETEEKQTENKSQEQVTSQEHSQEVSEEVSQDQINENLTESQVDVVKSVQDDSIELKTTDQIDEKST